ncbi:MAG TPA: hypothetical protein VLM17_04115 [Xanthomonadaceae bacterium]|nr:hypothetical protein [Xanthomonadaceae bacterium]
MATAHSDDHGRRPRGTARVPFLMCGLAFLGLAVANHRSAFLGVGLAFVGSGIALLGHGRKRTPRA